MKNNLLLIPNLDRNVKAEMTSIGIEFSYVLGCDANYTNHNYIKFQSRSGRWYVKHTWTVTYQSGFQTEIFRKYYIVKHAMMRDLCDRKIELLKLKKQRLY